MMMKKKKNWGLFFLVGLLFLGTQISYAESQVNFDQLVGFRAEPVLPSTQVDPSVGYFYLKEKPGSEEQIQVKLSNVGEQTKTVTLTINDAQTNRNGLIIYDRHSLTSKKDEIKMPITQLATLKEQEVTIPAHQTKNVTIKIKTPTTPFQGIALGGIVVKEKKKEKDSQGVSNVYTYTIGLALTEADLPNLSGHTDLKLVGVQPTVDQGYKYIEADILNPSPEIFDHVTVKGKVENTKGKQVFSEKLTDVSIAPGTVLPFSFAFNKAAIQSGTYYFKGEATAGGKTWKFNQKFTISANQAKTLNKKALNKNQVPLLNYLLLGLVVLLIIGGIIYWKKRQKSEKSEERK